MDEYIEREALRDALYEADAITMQGVKLLNQFPAADVAPIMRCKDCCHSYDDIGGLTCSYGPCVDCIVPEDFYCKHGETENWYEMKKGKTNET